MNAALTLLARREYSQKELIQRLMRQYPESEVIEVVSECIKRGFLSDERFVESRIRHRIQQGYGPLWIEQDLRQDGIDSDLIEVHLPTDEDFWVEQAFQLIQRKFANKDTNSPKFQRYMYQKGYRSSHIRQALQMINTREI